MGAVSWRSRKDIAAFIQQRFNGGAIALVPAAPRGQQDIFFLARESSVYQCHVILRQLRRNTVSLHQWVFVKKTAWQSMAYCSGSARRDRRFPLLTPWQYLRIRQPAALARDCYAEADND